MSDSVEVRHSDLDQMINDAREAGRREVWREIANLRPQKGQSWCWFCHAHATIDYSLNHHQDCLWKRAVEATREPERR